MHTPSPNPSPPAPASRAQSSSKYQTYMCPACRTAHMEGPQEQGISDEQAALQESYELLEQYQTELRRMKPSKPRNSYTIFSVDMYRCPRGAEPALHELTGPPP